MENECSSDLKESMKKNEIDFQMAPPHIHRRNEAEQVIRTPKNNFISGFSKTDPYLPIREWYQITSQCLINLNLLRNSRVNPALSAYAYLFGPYHFNKPPMAPPGTRVVFHKKPGNRTSWGHHGTQGWYIIPSLDHYICMQCYMLTAGIVQIIDTLQYTPKTFYLPKTTTEDYLQQKIGYIITIMKDLPNTIPLFYYGD